ncbi:MULTISPECIES: hypothetical protein [unclassified Thioalkalivibrio]|uniref:hypothetical protein n=1 Tax=unclassified Thioalkalivibrio TaxID=2621013 RepID=UPI00035F2C3A|nr:MULTISPECIES: hypothetical protein [unclassified Thioalkalivibrio]
MNKLSKDDELALAALRRAVANALERKRRLGQYAVVWRDGRTVRLSPEQIGSAEEYESGASAPPSAVREPGPDDEDPK